MATPPTGPTPNTPLGKKCPGEQDQFVAGLKFEKGDVNMVAAPRHWGRTTALGKAYAAARKKGITKIKFVCQGKTLNKEFFEEILPKCGVDDMFAMADNDALKLIDAELILVDDCHLRGGKRVQELVDVVRMNKVPVVLTSIVAEGDVMRNDERESLAPLITLKKRTSRYTCEPPK